MYCICIPWDLSIYLFLEGEGEGAKKKENYRFLENIFNAVSFDFVQ